MSNLIFLRSTFWGNPLFPLHKWIYLVVSNAVSPIIKSIYASSESTLFCLKLPWSSIRVVPIGPIVVQAVTNLQ